jgi:predicted RND superfamily exporter protein
VQIHQDKGNPFSLRNKLINTDLTVFCDQDSILIAIEHPESIFNAETLQKIADISEGLPQEFPEIAEGSVTSLYTADNITGSEWGLEVSSFFADGIPTDEVALQDLHDQIVLNEMIYGHNVSKDTTSALIIAEITEEADAQDLQKRLNSYVQQWEGPERLYVAGRPIVEGALAELGPADMARMFPIVVVVMIVVLLLLLRSIRDTILNMIIVLLGTVAAFGTMSLLSIPVYAVDTMIPVMLIAIGVAYGIHMHNAIHHTIRNQPTIGKRELIDQVLQAMVRPVFMAALTTAIGFSALMSSKVLPVRYFGLFSSIGVMTEMVLALILFPLSIHLLGIPKKGKETADEIVDEEIEKPDLDKHQWGRFIMKHPSLIVTISVLVAIFGIFGTQRVWIDTSFLANFEEDSAIVETDTFVNSTFGGTSSLNIILSAEENERFKDPEVLHVMDEMQTALLEHDMVGAGFSLTDFIKRMHKVMHADDEAFSVIPDDRELIAQYLLLYEFSGDPETLERVIDYDYRQANSTFQLRSDSSAVMSEVIAIADQFSPAFSSLGISLQYAGSGYKAYVFSELLLEGQIISLVLSFGIVALLLTLLFKNILTGIAGTVPIAITAVVNFGVMGMFGIPLSSATALISSIAIGIGVDYAIHLIEHYRNRRIEGYTIQQAAFTTIGHTGRAIIYNALAVMGGFAVLIFSVFPPNRQVGTLIVLNMATSAIGTLSILLVIITTLDKHGLFLRNIRQEKISQNKESNV